MFGCKFFPFITLNIFCHSLLACEDSAEKSVDNLMGVSFYETSYFSLAAFSLTADTLFIMCLGMGLLVYLLGDSLV